MIITKHVTKRVNKLVSELADKEPSIEQLVKDIKVIMLKAVSVKGIPVDMCEEVASKLIILSALARPMELSKE